METKYNQTLSFNSGLAEDVGIIPSIVFDELSFWVGKGARKDGWIYKSYAEMLERLPISEHQLRQAYKKLKAAGLIEVKVMKVNEAPTFHYRILKSLRMETEKIEDSIETEKIKETTIYTATHQQLDNSDSSLKAEPKSKKLSVPSEQDEHKDDFVDQERVDDRQMLQLLFEELIKELDTPRAKFPAERRAKLKRRLKTFKADELILAAKNIKASPHMQGNNDNNKFYGTIEYLLRNDGNVEKWLQEPVKKVRSAF